MTSMNTLFTRALARAAAALGLAGLAACGSVPSALPPAPMTAAAPDYSYIIGPGDNLNIVVWRNPELSMSVPVRPDGKVAAPLVDEVVTTLRPAAQGRGVARAMGEHALDHARGRGLAQRLYEELFDAARAAGHVRIVCEVNSSPPNPASDAFHARLGFTEVGAADIHGGAKTVRYLMRPV